MKDRPTIKEILFTAEGINDKPMQVMGDVERVANETKIQRAAIYRLLQSARDAIRSLSLLKDAEGACRVTCIQQLQSAVSQYEKVCRHYFYAIGRDESNEPDICAACGLDLRHEIHFREFGTLSGTGI